MRAARGRIPHDPDAAERARKAQAEIEARKPQNVTATKDVDGNLILTLDDGTVATLPTAKGATPCPAANTGGVL